MATLRRRVEGVLAREIEDGLLLLDTKTDLIHQLNETARFIWQHCDGAPSIGAVAERLADAFEVEQHIALVDVEGAWARLLELGLVSEV